MSCKGTQTAIISSASKSQFVCFLVVVGVGVDNMDHFITVHY